jgi:hypothetical protein
MKRKFEWIALGVLLLALAGLIAGNFRGSQGLVAVFTGGDRVDRFVVPNPTLRLDLLDKISKLEYQGTLRNIFAHAPAPPVTKAPAPVVAPTPLVDGTPREPPKLEVPFKFYGFVVDTVSGRRRGFFTSGEDVLVAAVGDTLQSRFKLVNLTNTRAEVEEISSGRRASLPLDESAAPGTASSASP